MLLRNVVVQKAPNSWLNASLSSTNEQLWTLGNSSSKAKIRFRKVIICFIAKCRTRRKKKILSGMWSNALLKTKHHHWSYVILFLIIFFYLLVELFTHNLISIFFSRQPIMLAVPRAKKSENRWEDYNLLTRLQLVEPKRNKMPKWQRKGPLR